MKRFLSTVALLFVFSVANRLMAQEPPADDQSGIYRLNPKTDSVELVRVEAEEIMPGLIYNYFQPNLNRRVWGIAEEDGTFQYAFGEGTIMPTSRFDLQISPDRASSIIQEQVPALQRELETVGGTPALRLDESNTWSLLPIASSARLFDLLTYQRWEWHGPHRKAVLHTNGNLWHIVNGKYQPMFVVWQGHEDAGYVCW